MKRLTLLVLALVGSLRGYSQMIDYPKNQVSAFYSKGQSLYTILNEIFLSGTPGARKTEGKESWEYTDFSGTYNVEYLRNFIKPWMSMGVQLGYEENRSKHWINRYRTPLEPNPDEHWTEKDRMPYILAVIQFDLLRSNWMGIYTKAGAGARLIFTNSKYDSGKTDDDFDWIPCFVGAVGLEVGPKMVRAFGEVGLGAQGFASIGIRSRF